MRVALTRLHALSCADLYVLQFVTFRKRMKRSSWQTAPHHRLVEVAAQREVSCSDEGAYFSTSARALSRLAPLRTAEATECRDVELDILAMLRPSSTI